MSCVLDRVKCPQCKYPAADFELNCRTNAELTACRKCGYHESWEPKYDKESNPCGWNHQVDRGAGAMCYHAVGAVATACHYFSFSAEVTKAERWLREKLSKGEVASDAYLLRWNKESKQIELIIGEFHHLGEEVEDESVALEKLRIDAV